MKRTGKKWRKKWDKCLKCRRRFLSTGKENRLCARCRRDNGKLAMRESMVSKMWTSGRKELP